MRAGAILAAIVLARIGFGYQIQVVASLGPEVMQRFHLDYGGLGSLIGVYMAPGVFTALPLGLLARRAGDRLTLGGGLAMMAAGGLLAPLAPGLAGIAAGRLIAGIGAVAMTVLQSKVIADRFPGPPFMLAVSVSVGAFPIGIGLAQIVAPVLARDVGWHAPFLAGGVEMALATALFLTAFRTESEGLRGFSLPSAAECRLLVAAGLMWTAYTAGYAGYLSYTPSLMAARGQGLVLTGIVMSLATWGNVAGTIAGGALAERGGAWPVLWIGTVVMTAAIAGMGAIDRPVAWAALLGGPGSIQSGVIVAVGTLSARPQHRAVGLGIFYTTYYLGGAVIPALCGRAADLGGGLPDALYAAAFVAALALPMWRLHERLAKGGAHR